MCCPGHSHLGYQKVRACTVFSAGSLLLVTVPFGFFALSVNDLGILRFVPLKGRLGAMVYSSCVEPSDGVQCN